MKEIIKGKIEQQDRQEERVTFIHIRHCKGNLKKKLWTLQLTKTFFGCKNQGNDGGMREEYLVFFRMCNANEDQILFEVLRGMIEGQWNLMQLKVEEKIILLFCSLMKMCYTQLLMGLTLMLFNTMVGEGLLRG